MDTQKANNKSAVSTSAEKVRRRGATSWQEFERALSQTVAGMAETTFLVISVPGTSTTAGDLVGADYYVQFAQRGDRGFRAEAVSNRFLAGTGRLSPDQERKMTELGWMPPGRDASEDKGDANWYHEWPQPAAAEVARIAVETLRGVYGVAEVSKLRYACWDTEGRHFALPELPIRVESADQVQKSQGRHVPPSADDLRPLVLQALKVFLKGNVPEPDADGDIQLQFGSAAVFVRVLSDPPRVRIFSPLLWRVAETPELLKAVNETNLNTLYGRAMWTGSELVMAIDVPAPGITAEAISFACFAIGSAADHFDEPLRLRFAGQTQLRADG